MTHGTYLVDSDRGMFFLKDMIEYRSGPSMHLNGVLGPSDFDLWKDKLITNTG